MCTRDTSGSANTTAEFEVDQTYNVEGLLYNGERDLQLKLRRTM